MSWHQVAGHEARNPGPECADAHGTPVEGVGLIWVAKGTRIKGDLRGSNVIVEGHVEGAVEAVGGVEVACGARVDGDIRAASLSLAAGSFYEGRVEITLHGPESTPLRRDLGIRRRPRGRWALAALPIVGALAALVFLYVPGRNEVPDQIELAPAAQATRPSAGEAVTEETVQPGGVALLVSTPESTRPEKSVAYSTGRVNIRSGPSTSAAIVRVTRPGERLEYIAEQDGWYQLATLDNKQWIYGRLVSMEPLLLPDDS